MVHRVDAVEHPVHRGGVADVADDELGALQPGRAVGVVRVHGGQQRVEHPHLVPGLEVGGDDVGADETGSAGDEDAHDGER